MFPCDHWPVLRLVSSLQLSSWWLCFYLLRCVPRALKLHLKETGTFRIIPANYYNKSNTNTVSWFTVCQTIGISSLILHTHTWVLSLASFCRQGNGDAKRMKNKMKVLSWNLKCIFFFFLHLTNTLQNMLFVRTDALWYPRRFLPGN